MDTESGVAVVEPHRASRINITLRADTKARLDVARDKRGIQINISQVCDRAINSELDRVERPGVADLVARLRIESDRRRGVPYRHGYGQGQEWARSKASWAEICHYATLGEADVKIGDVTWTWPDGETYSTTGFTGRFTAPEEDYRKRRPTRHGDGSYSIRYGAPNYLDEADDWVDDVHLSDQFWRGWLAGVQEVFEEVRVDLQPIAPQEPQVELGPKSFDVDPDDIPF